MRAILFEAPRKVRLIDDLPVPQLAEGEVLVRCTHVGLCGSNVGPYLGDGRWAEGVWPRPPGWMGHENVGPIVESRSEAWPEETLVLAQSRDYHGFVEYIACKPETVTRLPPTDDIGALVLAQPLATVLRAMSRVKPVVGERCAVIGQGPIGLMFTYLLKRMGARQVIGIDLVPWRLGWAQRLGATDVIDASHADVIEAVRELTGGAMVDLCVEAAGATESLSTAAFLPRWQGRLCVFGVPHHDVQPFPWYYTTNNETEILISRGAGWTAFAPTALEMVAGDGTALAEIVTPRLPWDRAAEAFEMSAFPGNHPDALKILLEL